MKTGIRKTLRFILLVLCLYMVKTSLAAKAPSPNKEMISNPFMVNKEACKDTIYLNDGRVFPITYLEETGMRVKYKKCDDPLNRTWKKDKSKVVKIVKSNGDVIDYSHTKRSGPSPSDNTSKIVGGAAIAILMGVLAAVGLGLYFVGSIIGVW